MDTYKPVHDLVEVGLLTLSLVHGSGVGQCVSG